MQLRGCLTHQFINDANQSMQVLFNGKVEGIPVFEVHWHAEDLAHLLKRQQSSSLWSASLQRETTEPAAEQDGKALSYQQGSTEIGTKGGLTVFWMPVVQMPLYL